MSEHRDCLVCGMEYDTAIEADPEATFQADAQICVWAGGAVTWVFMHEYGGGPRGGDWNSNAGKLSRRDDPDAPPSGSENDG